MTQRIIRKILGPILAIGIGVLAFSGPVGRIDEIPDTVEVFEGQQVEWAVAAPFTISQEVKEASSAALGTAEQSCSEVTLSLFGIPVKRSSVKVYPRQSLYVGGNAVGVAMYLDGVLVIGSNEVMTEDGPRNPAKEAGIKVGDVLKQVNGTPITDAMQLVSLVEESQDESVCIALERKGKLMQVQLAPAAEVQSGERKLGIWVRDSTAGVGTLTFVDPMNNRYGALGHAICDGDTGVLLKVREGEIFDCSIIGVTKGEKGSPGELKGMFGAGSTTLGDIKVNCDYGLFGNTVHMKRNSLYPQPVQIGSSSTVHEGKASIVCTVEGKEMAEYEVQIESVNRLTPGGFKGMILRITDQRLLDQTGGIIQGMSGSPILQDGRIIGAVTHVFISDPTRGYGLFIDKMLEAAG